MPHFRHRPQLRRVAVLLAAVVLAAMLPAAAQAHSFLIRSTPEAGARLVGSPRTLTLYFSEPFVRLSERISIRRIGAGALTLAAPTSSAAVVRQSLPPKLRGIFVVSWRVLSDDGHISLGEFAFAVGAGGALPTLSASTTRTPWSEVFATWLIFLGLALALGGIASERFVWKGMPASRPELPRAPAAAGLVLAALGALDQLVLLAGDRRAGGFGSGLSASAIGDAIATRPGRLTLALLIALAVAGPVIALRRLRAAALLPLVAAVVFIAVRGHSGTSGHSWAVLADVVHLVGAALWVGVLAHLVLIAARAPRTGPVLVEGARRYSRYALPTIAVILATGVVTAIPEFRSIGDLTSTSYGRTLLIKAGLIGLALLVALAARRRALPTNPHPRLLLLRRLTAGEATVLVVVLGAVAVLVNAAPPRSSAAPQVPQVGPPPLAGPAVRVADLAGQLVVGLAASENELQLTIVPPSARPQESVRLSAEALEPGGGSTDLYPRACGRECFTIRYQLKPGTTRIEAKVASSVWTGGEARFSVSAPLPAERPGLLRSVVETTKRLPSLHLTERVTSGPGSSTQPTGYTLSGRAFLTTEVFGSGAVDVVAIARAGGLTELAFAFPGANIWYRIWIDSRYRIRREQILSPGHLIRRSFTYGAGAAAPATGQAPGSPATSARVANPPPNAVVLGLEDGELAVGLAARSRGSRLELQTTVLGPDGSGAAGFDLSYTLRTTGGVHSAKASLCGSGCYQAVLPLAGTPKAVSVRLAGGGRPPSSVTFTLPARWPAPPAGPLLERATRVFRGLRSLVIHERLRSNPRDILTTTYKLEAPNRLSYQIKGGSAAVVVGARRWDRQPGRSWKASPQSPLRQPAPSWGPRPRDAHLLGSGRVDGSDTWVISFYDPQSAGFFTIWVDKQTLRTLKLSLTAAAHFMHHRYSGFNRPLRIGPPK